MLSLNLIQQLFCIVFQRCEMRIQMGSRYFKSMGVKHITHSGNCCNVCFLIISGHFKTNTEIKYYVDVYSI